MRQPWGKRDAAEDVDDADGAEALENYPELFEALRAERRPP